MAQILVRGLDDAVVERLRERAKESGGTLESEIREILKHAATAPPGTGAGPPSDQAAKPIWQVFDDIMSSVPDEELRRLPRDGAERHDQYLYQARATGSQPRDKGQATRTVVPDTPGKGSRPC